MAEIGVIRAYADVTSAREKLASARQSLEAAVQPPPSAASALKAVLADIDVILREIGDFNNAQNISAG